MVGTRVTVLILPGNPAASNLMTEYVLSPYIRSIESHLDPNNVRYAQFHQLTGDISEPSAYIRNLLWAARSGCKLAFDREELSKMGDLGQAVLELIEHQFLVSDGIDPFEYFLDHYPVRPIQNPAITYRTTRDELVVVRMSMAKRICSPAPGELPRVIEEKLSSPAAEVLMNANGNLTLQQIFERFGIPIGEGKKAVEFLSGYERQLIKLASKASGFDDLAELFNAVPRSLYHSAQWRSSGEGDVSSISEFHVKGIKDADWEFDFIETTVNHALRFPSEILDGLSYGARFSATALVPGVIGERRSAAIDILEVGGGTGTFACSFLKHACATTQLRLNYHILELSPALAANQKKLLASKGFNVEHFQQDATSFSIPRKFDLIIANEVIADFPISWVQKSEELDDEIEGEGAFYLEKYRLPVDGAPSSFRINSGVFEFVERAWEHLNAGGTVIVTEYGFPDKFPVQILHLSHEEFSIHFGQVKMCAERVGFTCRLLTLVEFLKIDEEVSVLAGTDQHIVCLNHVLNRFNQSLPFAVVTETDFRAKFQATLEEMRITGPRFLPLRKGYHYGPPINEFMVLIMQKPQ